MIDQVHRKSIIADKRTAISPELLLMERKVSLGRDVFAELLILFFENFSKKMLFFGSYAVRSIEKCRHRTRIEKGKIL